MATWKKILSEDSSGDVSVSNDLDVGGYKIEFTDTGNISQIQFSKGAIISNDINILEFYNEGIYAFKGKPGESCNLDLIADFGQDDTDQWRFEATDNASNNVLNISNYNGSAFLDVLKLGTTGDVEVLGDLTIGGDINSSGDITIDTIGSLLLDVGSTGPYMEFDHANSAIFVRSILDTDDYFKISVAGNGITTLKTSDDSGSNLADLHLDPGGDLFVDAHGDIILDTGSGNYTVEKSGSAMMTIDSDGNLTITGSIIGNTVITGDLQIEGNNITGSTGNALIEFSDNDIKLSDNIYFNSDSAILYFGASSVETLSISGQTEYIKILNEGDNISAPEYPLVIAAITSGTPATGYGVGIKFNVPSTTGTYDVGTIEYTYSDVFDDDVELKFKLMDSGLAPAEVLSISSIGTLTLQGDLHFTGTSHITAVDEDVVWNGINSLKINAPSSSINLKASDGEIDVVGGLEIITSSGFDVSSAGTINIDTNANQIYFKYSGTKIQRFSNNGLLLYSKTDDDDYAGLIMDDDDGSMSIVTDDDSGSSGGHLTLAPDGDLLLEPISQKTVIKAGEKLDFSGGLERAYIHMSFDSILGIKVGADEHTAIAFNGANFPQTQVTGGEITTAIGDDKILNVLATLNDDSDSGSMTFTLIAGDVTNTDSTGWDEAYLINLKQDGTSKFSVSTAGSMSIVRDITFGNGESIDNNVDGTIQINAAILKTGIAGYLTLVDNEIDVSSGNLDIDVAGSIILDSATGGFEMHGAGTVPKFADMYAGMILGYTDIHPPLTDRWNISTSWSSYMTIIGGSGANRQPKVTFVVPPSGKVEIGMFLPYVTGASGNLYAGLATNTSALTLGAQYEDLVWDVDETDAVQINHRWTVEGLTAGDELTYYIMIKSGLGSPRITFGGDSSGNGGGIKIWATALPATIYDGT